MKRRIEAGDLFCIRQYLPGNPDTGQVRRIMQRCKVCKFFNRSNYFVIDNYRAGEFDPAVLFYLADKGHDMKTLNNLCNKKSGLLGISGVSNDMRNLEKLSLKDNRRVKLAIDIFCYRIKKYIGTYAAVLGTVDAVIFTGGIGENSWKVRAKVCRNLPQIGIELDKGKNRATIAKEGQINSAASKVKVFVIPTDEEIAIAKDSYKLAL